MYITGIDDCGRTSYIPHSNHILCGCLLPRLSAEDCTAVLRILSPCANFDVDDEGVLPRFCSRVQQGKWRSGLATLLLVLYTGYAIQEPSMVAGLGWLTWISVSDTFMLKVNMLPDKRSLQPLRYVLKRFFRTSSTRLTPLALRLYLGLRTVPYTVTAVLLGSVYGYGPYITDRILRFEMLYTVRDGRNTAVYGNTDV